MDMTDPLRSFWVFWLSIMDSKDLFHRITIMWFTVHILNNKVKVKINWSKITMILSLSLEDLDHNRIKEDLLEYSLNNYHLMPKQCIIINQAKMPRILTWFKGNLKIIYSAPLTISINNNLIIKQWNLSNYHLDPNKNLQTKVLLLMLEVSKYLELIKILVQPHQWRDLQQRIECLEV